MFLYINIVVTAARHHLRLLLRACEDASDGCTIGQCHVHWFERAIEEQNTNSYGDLSGKSLPRTIYLYLTAIQGLQIVFGSLLTMAFRNWIQPEEEARAKAKLEEEEQDTATGSELAQQFQEPRNAPAD